MADTNLKGTVHIKVREDVKLEDLNRIVSAVAGMTGCRTCGILGLDLRLSGDPVEARQIESLPGVKSVEFSE